MNQPAPNATTKKGRTGKSVSSPFRKIGYIVVIIIMFILLYLVRNYERWHLYFLTADFDKCLFYIELSIYATIGANVLFIIYDNRWFKHLVQVVTGIAGALSLIMFYVIYPLNLHESWNKWVRIGLLIIFGFSVIGIIVDLIKGFRYLVKEPEAV
jgi:hypothetical protein